MKHFTSPDDERFRIAFESQQVAPEQFNHGAHVRLAYIYLCEHDVEGATERMKTALLAFLAHRGIDHTKYHETITQAWVMAVDYFMAISDSCLSCADLVRMHPQLLDSKIMLTHYSADVLFAPAARQAFVAPNLQSIPPTAPV